MYEIIFEFCSFINVFHIRSTTHLGQDLPSVTRDIRPGLSILFEDNDREVAGLNNKLMYFFSTKPASETRTK